MIEKLPEQVETLLNQHDYDNLSLANVLCERHDQSKVAFYFENENGDKHVYTYGELNNLSKKFATVLKDAGVKKGTKVAVLLPKGAETFISALAMWRLGAVYVPLFTAFERQAIGFRIEHSGATVVLTDADNRSKVTGAFDELNDSVKENIQVITINSNNQDD